MSSFFIKEIKKTASTYSRNYKQLLKVTNKKIKSKFLNKKNK